MRASLTLLALLACAGCTSTDSTTDTEESVVDTEDTEPSDSEDTEPSDTEDTEDTEVDVDADSDGDLAVEDGGTDCDDTDPTVYAGADESCDEVDSDCDGDLVDGFEDLDRDGMPDCVDDDVCAVAPDSLLMWLQGDDDSDSVGTAEALDSSDTMTFERGIVGDAMGFDGGSGVWDLSPDPWLVSPISIEVWLKTAGTGESQVVLSHYECGGDCSRNGVTSPSSLRLYLDSEGMAALTIRDADAENGTIADQVEGTTELTDDVWHHLVGVVDPASGTLSLYVDGALDADVALVHNDASGFAQDGDDEIDPITIGWSYPASSTTPENLFEGQLDELSVYAAALTAAEVESLHGAGIAGKCE